MIRLFVFLLVFSLPALAADRPVSLHLDHMPVVDLAKLVYADVTKQDFVIDSSVLDLKDQITVHLQDVDKKHAVSVLEALLSSSGVLAQKREGVIFLKAKPKEDRGEIEEELFYYRPRFRSVNYILDLCTSLFKTGRFSAQRVVRQAAPAPAADHGAVSQPSVPVQKSGPAAKSADTGTSAQSQIDKEQDAFIFSGPVQEVEKLKKLLVQVDQPSGEVLVKAFVYEVSTSEQDGSAFGLALNLLQGKLGLALGNSVNLGNSISFKNSQIDAIYSAFANDSRFKVVSSPSLRVLSGSSARFSVGSDVPVLGAVQMDRNGNPIQSVEYKPSGVILDLRPHVRENQIDLTINQQLSNFIPTTTGVNNSPTLTKREIQTSIAAQSDDVIVLGGLDEDKAAEDKSGLSFLPALFKSRGGQSSKTQILLVLQVHKI